MFHLVYEGGHRVPMLFWWPLGIHQSLHGTNFDLPVSQADFFATFADILHYPLPPGDSCVYSFNSQTATAHNQDATKIGRPTGFGKSGKIAPNRWLAEVQKGTEHSEFDASVVMRANSGKSMYAKEYVGVGPDRHPISTTSRRQHTFARPRVGNIVARPCVGTTTY